MKKIKCLFIDDQEKEIEHQINSWEEDFSDEDYSLFQEFSFTFKKSNKKTNANDLMDECMAFDFIILDQMAASDDAGNGLAQAIGRELAGVNTSYCIYTNETGIDVRKTFKDVNIYKKEEKVTDKFKIEHDCDGGFIDMLKHIKSDTGFNKYCKFLRFTNNQDLEELIRIKLSPIMNNYLEIGECEDIDNGYLLKFCDFLCEELAIKEIFPNFPDPFYQLTRTTTSIIEYLNSPKLFLNNWLSNNYWAANQTFENESKYCKERVIFKDSMNDIILKRKLREGKTPAFSSEVKSHSHFFDDISIGDSFCSTLIGQSLNTIWKFRCSDGHKGQKDQNNHALKLVYESILLICERLSIIFERIDELKSKSLDVEEIEPVSEIKEDSSNQSTAEDTPAEQVTNLAEKSEEPIKEDGVIKAKAKGIGVKTTGQKIDLTQFKKPENL